ncbi:MAG: TauD/TfdA family dioxygenase [Acidimicrobiia bacterium]
MSSSIAEVSIGPARAGSASEALLAACGATQIGPRAATVPETGALFLVLVEAEQVSEPAGLVAALGRGQRIVVAAAPGAALTLAGETFSVAPRPIETSSALDPLVADVQIDAVVTTGPHTGAVLTTRDLAVVSGGNPIARAADGQVVAAALDVGAGTVVVVGSDRIATDTFLVAGRTADIVAWMLTGRAITVSEPLRRLMVGPEVGTHVTPPVVTTLPQQFDLSLLPRGAAIASPEFTRAAGRAGRLLPEAVHDALLDFADNSDPSGALLVRGLPLGDLPRTPERPTAPADKDRTSEFVLLTVARRLGQPIGYLPEHGGDLVQNILPVRGSESRQVSTSSKVELMFHTEAAFHPHRPRFLLLLCLRGDPQARTTLASIHETVRMLPLGVRRTLFEPRFRTAADESYVGARPTQLGLALPVLSGDWDDPHLVFDADLMVGVDEEADAALRALSSAVETCHTGVVLEPGDLLVVDNSVAVHGRSPFTPRFDGTDRWLQRTFVVSDLAPSAGDREGRIIATRFAG